MKSAVETLNPTRVKLTVEVTFDELKPSLDAAYKAIGQQVTVPGFRKGHIPQRIIDQRVGRGAVLEEAVNDALPKFYQQAVVESSVRPLGQPTVDVTDVPDASGGGELKFTAEVDVRPAIELPDLTRVELTVDDLEITDEDVDARLQNLRERFGTLVTVERPAADGDFVTLGVSAEIDGQEIDSVKGVSYQVGTGQMLEGMDEVLPGLSAGEVTTFEAPLAGGDRKGETATVTVTMEAVKDRTLPELDDDFAQLASEFDTLEELRADLVREVTQAKQMQQVMQANEKLIEFLTAAVEVPVPDQIIADEVHRHLEQEGRLEDDEHRAEVEEETRTTLRNQLLLDAVAEKEEVGVTQAELIDFLVASSRQYGMEPNEFFKAVEQSGQIPAMAAEVARRKALATVLSRAQVTDASGNAVDMSSLAPDFRPPAPSAEEAAGQAAEQISRPAAAPATPEPASAADPAALPSFDLGGFVAEDPAEEPAPSREG